jgi:iron complex outermembrane receptor protein
MALAFGQARADGSALDQDLTQASLEQLMEIQVTSVARKDRSLARTAAAVYVITAEILSLSSAHHLSPSDSMSPPTNCERAAIA